MRRSREEILDLYRACQAKFGRVPGIASFCKATSLKKSEVEYYWARWNALVKEAGGQPNEFVSRLSDEEVFADYAKVCLHLRKIPTEKELRIARSEERRVGKECRSRW